MSTRNTHTTTTQPLKGILRLHCQTFAQITTKRFALRSCGDSQKDCKKPTLKTRAFSKRLRQGLESWKALPASAPKNIRTSANGTRIHASITKNNFTRYLHNYCITDTPDPGRGLHANRRTRTLPAFRALDGHKQKGWALSAKNATLPAIRALDAHNLCRNLHTQPHKHMHLHSARSTRTIGTGLHMSAHKPNFLRARRARSPQRLGDPPCRPPRLKRG